MFDVFIGIMALAGLLSFINSRFLKLPDTIGVMLLAIVASGLIGSIFFVDQQVFKQICMVVEEIDFKTILFNFLLAVLLFAGAIHVNLKTLLSERGPVILYASFGVIVSTFLIGTGFYFLCQLIGINMDFIMALVFGALISPTDPVAVLSLLKKAKAPQKLEIKIVGESLFNDGVGIVVFISLLSIAMMPEEVSIAHIGKEFLFEAGGGLLLGFVLSKIGSFLIKQVATQPVVAVHITLAIVLGGYSVASFMHVSGALAMVVAGLGIGHMLHKEKSCVPLQSHMNIFWKVLDEVFNAVLFVLIGLELFILEFESQYFIIGAISVGVVLGVRLISILLANVFLRSAHRSSWNESIILTWAGLRGGISIALALSLDPSPERDAILVATYVVVFFSIVVQGLTITKLVRKLIK